MVKNAASPAVKPAQIAVNAWQGRWEAERANFAALARGGSGFDHPLLAGSQSRLSLLFRQLHARGELGDVSESVAQAATSKAWRAWRVAVEVMLAGRDHPA
jgi:hypothetical protein